jgi:hypothetical protein
MNSKTFWHDDFVLKTSEQRQKVEYLVEKMTHDNNKFSTKLKKFFKKLF